jgi:membrane protein DedA with SNARE-associated domain
VQSKDFFEKQLEPSSLLDFLPIFRTFAPIVAGIVQEEVHVL